MGAPHSRARYGETWQQERINATLIELEPLRTLVVLSGGWAWHFMSPEDHPEYKHLHDHKDVDFFVHPNEVGSIFTQMQVQGFIPVRTRFDNQPGGMTFKRFEKIMSPSTGKPFKITLDMFVGNVPFRVVRDLWRVVTPEHLLGLYDSVHSSSECFAVIAARHLLAQGLDPVGNQKLAEIPLYPK